MDYDLIVRKAIQIALPDNLNEISGIAYNEKGKLFCHNDEWGIIYQIDDSNGMIVKKFQLGEVGLKGDFEDLAIAGKRFFIIESNGTLYEFTEGRDNEKVKVKSFGTLFSSNYEIEGLCYDDRTNSLLIAVKNYSGKKYKNLIPIFRFSLEEEKIIEEPYLLIDEKILKDKYQIGKIYPSGISVSPYNNHIYIVSSKGESAIMELTRKGEIISAAKLGKKLHQQPEGIYIRKDGTLLISDERVKQAATITFYKMQNKKS